MINSVFKKKHSVAVIDFSDGWLKIITADEGLSNEMEEPFIYVSEFNPGPESKLSRKEFNRLLWGVLKKRPEHIYGLLARKYATVRFLRLPSSDEREIAGMLEFQALKELPFSKDEIVTAYKILSSDNEGYSRVMLVVAQKNIIDNKLGLFKTAGVMPEGIYLSAETTLNWFLLRNKPGDSSLYVLVDVDSSFSELLICRGREILFTRPLEHGAFSLRKCKTLQEVNLWADIFKEQLRVSYISFKKEYQKEHEKAENIFLSGAIPESAVDPIKRNLFKEFNVPVEFCGYSRQNNYPVSLSSAAGAVYNQQAIKINIIPSDLKLKRLRENKKEELVKFYALICSLFACAFILIGARFLYKVSYVNYIDGQLQQLRPYVQKAELIEDKIKVARAHINTDNTVLEALRELYNIMPQNITIFGFSANDDGAVSIRGISEEMSGVFDAVALLEKSARFKNVKVIFTNKRKLAQQEIVDFQVSCVSERQV